MFRFFGFFASAFGAETAVSGTPDGGDDTTSQANASPARSFLANLLNLIRARAVQQAEEAERDALGAEDMDTPDEEPVAQDDEEPVAQDEEEPVAQDEEEPVAQDEEEPVAQDEEEPVAQDEEEPVAQDEEEPVAQDEEEPVAQDEEEPVAQDEEEPVGDSDHGGMDMPDHGSHGGHDHGGHMPAVPVPGIGASQAAVADYLAQLADLEETHVHDMDDPRAAEHMRAMDLVPRGEADVVAIGSGDWFDSATWSTGTVPTGGQAVLIPEGVSVYYDDVSDAELFTVRVDGELAFATDENSRMIFDTMVVSPSGRLEIGTADQPVQEDVAVELVIANNGPIDTDWDPTLLSRGLISHGEAEMHGAAKDSHEKIIEDPMAGDTSISFDSLPEGWAVGDTIVIAGTNYDGYNWDNDIRGTRLYPPEDEIREISSIDGNTVYFEDELIHDHDTPRDDLKTSVANYSRNISIKTQEPETAEIHERGHVMFMHSDDVDVRYVAFEELGRTDKSEDSFDISNIDTVRSDSNVQGRYAVHLHRTGVGSENDPAILEGNAVWGSPGWGYVHHDSHAVLTNNASYDTFGAGYVAETGNETGAWNDNIAIWAQGNSWDLTKNQVNRDEFDTARSGDGFWFQGRLVESTDNVAASVNTGFVYFHRNGDDRMIDVPAEDFEYSDALFGDTVSPDDVSIRDFSGNETFAASTGLEVVKANPNQGHDVWSHLDDFTAWNVENGAHLEYTAHYLLTDFDLVGKEPSGFSGPKDGISLGSNTTEVVIQDSRIDGFRTGIDLESKLVGQTLNDGPDRGFVVMDTTITGANVDIAYNDPATDRVLNSSELPAQEVGLQIDGPLTYKEGWPDPGARYVSIEGTKTDGLGEAVYPGGTDGFGMDRGDVVRTLETDGYWTTSQGQHFFLTDLYFTDRATGDVYYETHPVYLDDNVPLGSPWNQYEDAVSNGVADIEARDGVTYLGDRPLDVPVLADTSAAEDDIMTLLTSGHGMHDEAMPDAMGHAHMQDDDEQLVA